MDIQSVSLQKLLRQTPMEPITPKFQYWDPDGTELNNANFAKDREKIEAKYEKYKTNPEVLRRNLILLLLVVVIEIIASITFPAIISDLSKNKFGLAILITPVLIAISYVIYIYKLQTDLVKIIIAKENNWLYGPEENPLHWSSLRRKYPEIFDKGNKGQNMQDEFWGKFKNKKQPVNFYSAIFEYQIESGTGKNRHTQTFAKTTFALQLNKKIKADFRLEPEGLMNKFLNVFRSKEINTESAEFNKAFAVFYAGQKVEKELEIVKTLSPAVQMKLLDLKEKKGTFAILFHEDVVIFIFENNLFKKLKTNFFKKVELAPEDKEMIQETLNTILEISSEIIQYLD